MMFHAGGTQHELRGARGTCSFNYENGTSPMIDFELTCLYTAATSVTLPTATFTNQAKPLAFNSQNTATVDIFGYAACLEALSLDMANEVIYRQLAGCTENVQLTDRKPVRHAEDRGSIPRVEGLFRQPVGPDPGQYQSYAWDCGW